MTNTTYPTARKVAVRAQKHFTKHVELAQKRGRSHLAEVPTAAIIETMIDAAFWASLRREEGLTPKISLALRAARAGRPAAALRAAAAAAPAGAGASSRRRSSAPAFTSACGATTASLRVWGTTRELPALCFVLEVVASGLLVIKHRSETFGKFVNVAVLEGDQIKIVDEATRACRTARRR